MTTDKGHILNFVSDSVFSEIRRLHVASCLNPKTKMPEDDYWVVIENGPCSPTAAIRISVESLTELHKTIGDHLKALGVE